MFAAWKESAWAEAIDWALTHVWTLTCLNCIQGRAAGQWDSTPQDRRYGFAHANGPAGAPIRHILLKRALVSGEHTAR